MVINHSVSGTKFLYDCAFLGRPNEIKIEKLVFIFPSHCTLVKLIKLKRIQSVCTDSKVNSACVRVSELFRTEFLDTTINNCQTD